MKTWKKIVRLLILIALIVPAAAVVAVQIPAVQTAAVRKAADFLSGHIDGRVDVGKVYFSYPNSLILKNVDVIQGDSDTLAHLGKALVKIKATSLLFSKEARIRRVSLEDGHFTIRRLDESTTNLSALLAPLLGKEKKEDGGGGLPWECIRLDRLTLKHIDFAADSLALRDINLSARNIHYTAPLEATARIDNLTLEGDNDLKVNKMSADIALGSEGLHVDGLRYEDGWTSLDADRIALGFSSFDDFNDFLDKVSIDASLQPSLVDLRTAKAFIPLKTGDLALWLDGSVKGTVSNLASNRLRIQSASKHTVADLKFRIKGLPDLEKARVNAEITQLKTSTADLAEIISGIQPGFRKSSLTRYAPGETITLTAQADGYLSQLTAKGHLGTSSMGSADLDAIVRKQGKRFGVEGTASTSSLQLGRLLDNKSIGSLTCQTDVDFSTSGKHIQLDVSPLRIDSFHFNGYDYHDIIAAGSMQDDLVQADIVSNDPNLQMTLHGNIDLGGKGRENRYLL
ncbi:MAG: hypothetical protein IJ636_07340, partial [Bacteroidales bacterium]|nr:hypothetical protein [Bacteroidales bacterium]